MSYVGKIIDLVALGSTAAAPGILRRLLPRLFVIVGLTIVASLLAAALALVGFYAIDVGLVFYGLTAQTAFAVTGALGLLTLLALIGLIALRLRRIRDLPHNIPLLSNVEDLAATFMKGFMERGEWKGRDK